jgi:hypothetical protein
VSTDTGVPEEVALTAEQAEQAWSEELKLRQDPASPAASEPQATEPVVETPPEEKKPPTLEERFNQLETAYKELSTEHGRIKGRLSSLQSTVDTAKAASKATNGPTDTQIAAAAEDPEEWKQLMQDFPDWGVAFEKKMDAKIRVAMTAQPTAAPEQPDIEALVGQQVMKREIAWTGNTPHGVTRSKPLSSRPGKTSRPRKSRRSTAASQQTTRSRC